MDQDVREGGAVDLADLDIDEAGRPIIAVIRDGDQKEEIDLADFEM